MWNVELILRSWFFFSIKTRIFLIKNKCLNLDFSKNLEPFPCAAAAALQGQYSARPPHPMGFAPSHAAAVAALVAPRPFDDPLAQVFIYIYFYSYTKIRKKLDHDTSNMFIWYYMKIYNQHFLKLTLIILW